MRCVQFTWNEYYLMDFHAHNHTHSITTIYDLWRTSKRKSILRHHVYQIQLTFQAERKSFQIDSIIIANASRKCDAFSAQRSSFNCCVQFLIDFEMVLKYLLSARRCTCALSDIWKKTILLKNYSSNAISMNSSYALHLNRRSGDRFERAREKIKCSESKMCPTIFYPNWTLIRSISCFRNYF